MNAQDIISTSASAAEAEIELGLQHLACRDEIEGLAAVMSENLRREGVDVDAESIIDALDELIRLAAHERQAEREDAEAA